VTERSFLFLGTRTTPYGPRLAVMDEAQTPAEAVSVAEVSTSCTCSCFWVQFTSVTLGVSLEF
jgi:hypothetical protein